ncbi:hypothetical protein MPOCJGCO_2101 [Methylobacterium trifolii]|uniref:Uncharacterized protein n=1 Tax=Methylobacterium trifolii TaxID=1003092 RepID=A0ABQ4U0X9_9HYPH|nr:hypothetical protein MPOCJGCO_2101 [Methylobacterium trifolii]
MNGILIGSEPAAMIAWSKPITVFLPSCSTSTWFGLTKRPVPRTTVTLRCLASPTRPPVRRLTTPSFQSRSLSMSICGAVKLMPWEAMAWVSSMTFAACSRAFDGMQPTLRQTPPSVAQRSTSTTLLPRSAARKAAV